MDVTPHGFNMKEASLDEKMEYMQSLYKKMNRNYASGLGVPTAASDVCKDPSYLIAEQKKRLNSSNRAEEKTREDKVECDSKELRKYVGGLQNEE